MKAVLEFKLPDEQHEFDSARLGSELLSELSDFSNVLRSAHKYDTLGGKLVSKMKPYEIIDAIRDEFYQRFGTHLD